MASGRFRFTAFSLIFLFAVPVPVPVHLFDSFFFCVFFAFVFFCVDIRRNGGKEKVCNGGKEKVSNLKKRSATAERGRVGSGSRSLCLTVLSLRFFRVCFLCVDFCCNGRKEKVSNLTFFAISLSTGARSERYLRIS